MSRARQPGPPGPARSTALPAVSVLAILAIAAGLAAGTTGVARAADDSHDSAAAQALLREGMKHLQAGSIERAARQFERAVQLAPSDPVVYIHLARARGAARRFAEAHKVLAKAAIHAQGEKKLMYEVEIARGDLHRDEGHLDKARADYQRAADLRMFNREARERLRALDAGSQPPEE